MPSADDINSHHLTASLRDVDIPERLRYVKVKVKEVDLYSAFIVVPHTQKRSGTDHTVLPTNYTVPAYTS